VAAAAVPVEDVAVSPDVELSVVHGCAAGGQSVLYGLFWGLSSPMGKQHDALPFCE